MLTHWGRTDPDHESMTVHIFASGPAMIASWTVNTGDLPLKSVTLLAS